MKNKNRNKISSEIKKEEKKLEEIKLLPTEWARTFGKNERFYTYYDKKLGIITKEKFNSIEI